MSEDGEFVCEEHKSQSAPAQWVVDARELNVKCDHCEKLAAHYVLEQTL